MIMCTFHCEILVQKKFKKYKQETFERYEPFKYFLLVFVIVRYGIC